MGLVEMFFDGDLGSSRHPIMSDRFLIGRREGDIVVPHELWMSGRHAEIQRRKIGSSFRWFLVDQNSTNGIFVRTDAVVLSAGDELFLGRERYRFIDHSPQAGLLHVTRGAAEQWMFARPSETFGSSMEHPLQCIANDPFLDPVHAFFVRGANSTWTIRDNNSRNGVWYRIREIELNHGMDFQLGEQRFRFYCESFVI